MKKILSLLSVSILGIFLLFPLLLSGHFFHASMNMGEDQCIDHCITSAHTELSESLANFQIFQEFFFLSSTYKKYIEIPFLAGSLIFFIILATPPWLQYKIKNASYSSLIGIIKCVN